MARYELARWMPISGSIGDYRSGPFKIVHHTTEVSSAEHAFSIYRRKRCDPHFTVDENAVFQHIDTGEAARGLRNNTGSSPETNRDSAIQIEVVGFAHLPKGFSTLNNVAKLCRWIELTHSVPRIWPSGFPKPAERGRDPGGHNRNAAAWESESGHYGHCHVPENTHWDPGYSAPEVEFLMSAQFDEQFKLPDEFERLYALRLGEKPSFAGVESTMPDHADQGSDL